MTFLGLSIAFVLLVAFMLWLRMIIRSAIISASEHERRRVKVAPRGPDR